MGADFRAIMRGHEDRKALRQPRESEWQLIADHFMPRKDMTVTPVPGQLRKRTVTSGAPQTALKRGAAMLMAYMIDPTRPFVKPNVQRGLVAAGRSREMSDEARDYLAGVEWDCFDRMMLPQGGFLSSSSRVAMELAGFGTGVQWVGRKRGFGPKYQARALRRCYLAQDDEGEVDTLDYCWPMPVWKVLETYPEARASSSLLRLAADEKTERQMVDVLHTIEPRRRGRAGAAATEKPFADTIVIPEHKIIAAESGWDSFPYAVPRLNLEDGSPYGSGWAWDALPDAMVLNHIQAAVERGVEIRVDPITFLPVGFLDGAFDRRPGAVNFYDQVALGFQSIKEAFQTVNGDGDPNIGVEYMRWLTGNIDQCFFVDWMRLRENGNMTATEVNDRRDMRLRGMSAVVPSIDRDWMGSIADRTLEVMIQEDQLPPPPKDLAEVEVDWDYAGPLAIAQQGNQAEAINRLFDAALKARELDPDAVAVVEVAEGLRGLSEAWAVPFGVNRSRQAVADIRAAKAEEQDRMMQAQLAEQAARAAQGGAQAVSTLAGIPGGEPQPA